MISFPLRSSCCMKGKFLGDRGYSYWPLWWYGDQDKLNDFAGNCMLSVSGAYFDGNGYHFDGINDYLIDADSRKVLQDGTEGTWSSIILTDGEVPPEGSIQGTGTKLCLNISGTVPKITGKIILYPDYCPNLTDLRCYNNSIFVLDVNALTLLTLLSCSGNSISVLGVSALTLLTVLNCYSNSISVLDVSALTSLTYLHCGGNSMNQAMVDTVLCDMAAHSTSNGTLNISGNAVPSATGLACRDDLVSRGWTVTVDS